MTAPTATTARRLVSQRVALVGADGALRVGPACVDLEGARIAAVHDAPTSAPPPAEGAVVEDLGDRLLTPAFVDAHTHVALTALRGLSVPEDADRNLVEDFFFRIETAMSADDVRAFARMGAYEAILNGTALVWDHYYRANAMVAAFRDVGIAAVLAPTVQDVAGPGIGQLEEALAATIAIGGDAALADAGVFAAFGPHATDTVSPTLFLRIAGLAEQHALPVHVHVAQSLDEVERVHERHGISPYELLARSGLYDAAPRTLLIHNIFATSAELAALPRERVALGFCPHSKQIFAWMPDVGTWQGLGLPWFVATDCAASNDATNVQRDLRAAAGLRTAGLATSAAHRAFVAEGGVERARAAWDERVRERAATRWLGDTTALLSRVWSVPGGLHPAFRAGVIEAGALANLCVWDVEHPAFWPGRDPLRALAMSDTTNALVNVMSAGRWLGEHGRYHASVVGSDAYREARVEATRRLAEVEQRVRG
ncbi:MAG: amidohydrolase family protein [Deltaproteobacteria bacterium]|nr:amidohydrolase family protein [Deltaproteobacteria bacterium]